MPLALALEIDAERLQSWNDERQRTQQDVLAAYDRALELLPHLVARFWQP